MHTNNFNWRTDSSLNRDYNWDPTIAETCIIALADNPQSQAQAQQALHSCEYVGQPSPWIFDGYDGTDRETIRTPRGLTKPGRSPSFFARKDRELNNVMSWIKVLDTALSVTEVACALSHIALWTHCININRPIVILEHDAYMVRPYTRMTYTNSCEYLGHSCELNQLFEQTGTTNYLELVEYLKTTGRYPDPVARLPVTMIINYNFLFSHGLHAYAIDPFMARRLFAHVLTEGLINPVDAVLEVTSFELVQSAVYAVLGHSSANSTIDVEQNLSGRSGRKHTNSIPGVSQ